MKVVEFGQGTIPTHLQSSVLFEQMDSIGKELLAAIKIERELAEKMTSADATRQEKWRAARTAAETLEQQYSVVFAAWLGAIRVETQLAGNRRHRWASGIDKEQNCGTK